MIKCNARPFTASRELLLPRVERLGLEIVYYIYYFTPYAISYVIFYSNRSPRWMHLLFFFPKFSLKILGSVNIFTTTISLNSQQFNRIYLLCKPSFEKKTRKKKRFFHYNLLPYFTPFNNLNISKRRCKRPFVNCVWYNIIKFVNLVSQMSDRKKPIFNFYLSPF